MTSFATGYESYGNAFLLILSESMPFDLKESAAGRFIVKVGRIPCSPM